MLTTKENEAKEKIILALDTDDIEQAIVWTELLSNKVGMFKIGLELFIAMAYSPIFRTMLLDIIGDRLFLDLKFHDIPTTVKGAVKGVARYNPRFFTVHAVAGPHVLEEAVRNCGNAKVAAVTVLSSDDESEIMDSFVIGERREVFVLEYALRALRAGAQALVCAPKDLHIFTNERHKRNFERMLKIAAGTRPSWYRVSDDQKNALTPAETIQAGADYIVIGRPITTAYDPVEAARMIIHEIKEVL